MVRFEEKKSFNIASTVINENIRVSTAAIFYQCFFGDRFQMETFVFMTGNKGSQMKIHEVPENQQGIDYCLKFHNHVVGLIKCRLNK